MRVFTRDLRIGQFRKILMHGILSPFREDFRNRIAWVLTGYIDRCRQLDSICLIYSTFRYEYRILIVEEFLTFVKQVHLQQPDNVFATSNRFLTNGYRTTRHIVYFRSIFFTCDTDLWDWSNNQHTSLPDVNQSCAEFGFHDFLIFLYCITRSLIVSAKALLPSLFYDRKRSKTTCIASFAFPPIRITRLSCLWETGCVLFKRTIITSTKSDTVEMLFKQVTVRPCRGYTSHCTLSRTIQEIALFTTSAFFAQNIHFPLLPDPDIQLLTLSDVSSFQRTTT